MACEMGNPLRKKDRRKMADLVRLFVTTEDADIVTHLRDMPSHDRHLLSARIRIETSWICDCSWEYDMQEKNYTLDAVPDIVSVIVIGKCPCIHGKSDFGGPEVSFQLIHLATLMKRKQTINFLFSLDESLLNSRTGEDSETTPFFLALENHDVELMTYLLKLGANVNIFANYGEYHVTPLVFAVEDGNWESFKLLVSCPQCDVNAEFDGRHPLSVARNLEMVKCLLKAGADPNKGLTNAVSNGDSEILSALIEAGAKVDGTMEKLILQAVREQKTGICRVFLEAGVNVNPVSSEQVSPLGAATSANNPEIVQLLLGFGADPNRIDYEGYTPLHDAATEGYEEVLHLLLDGGAKPDLRTEVGYTPLNLAAYGGWYSIVELLLSLGCNPSNAGKNLDTALHYAADNGCLETARILVAAGADPNAENACGTTPLWYAVFGGHVDVVRFLVQLNVNLSVPSVGLHLEEIFYSFEVPFVYDRPQTPLWVAVDRVFPEVVEVLLAGGYNIWREKWLGELIDPDIFDDPESMTIISRLSALYSSPPSLLHLSTMFFRERFKLQLGAIIKDLPIPYTVKDILGLDGASSLAE